MPRSRKISVEVQWIVVWLSSLLQKEDIAIYTGLSEWSIVDILQKFHTQGTIQIHDKERKESKWQLCDLDAEVCHIFLR